jgi:hypothetical protein
MRRVPTDRFAACVNDDAIVMHGDDGRHDARRHTFESFEQALGGTQAASVNGGRFGFQHSRMKPMPATTPPTSGAASRARSVPIPAVTPPADRPAGGRASRRTPAPDRNSGAAATPSLGHRTCAVVDRRRGRRRVGPHGGRDRPRPDVAGRDVRCRAGPPCDGRHSVVTIVHGYRRWRPSPRIDEPRSSFGSRGSRLSRVALPGVRDPFEAGPRRRAWRRSARAGAGRGRRRRRRGSALPCLGRPWPGGSHAPFLGGALSLRHR